MRSLVLERQAPEIFFSGEDQALSRNLQRRAKAGELQRIAPGVYVRSGDDEEIAICHGGVNANELVLMTLLSTNDHILSFLPTYQQLYSFPESLGVEVDFIHLKEENEWKIDFEELEKNIRENTRMICLNLPNNPTGTTLDHEEMQQLIQILMKILLMIMVKI